MFDPVNQLLRFVVSIASVMLWMDPIFSYIGPVWSAIIEVWYLNTVDLEQVLDVRGF